MKKVSWSQVLIVMLALVFASAAPSDAGVTTYNNAAAWLATATYGTEAAVAGGTTTAGVQSVVSSTPIVYTGNKMDNVIASPGSTQWNFVAPIMGFAGIWDLAGPGGPGTGIMVTLLFEGGDEFTLLEEINKNLSNGFFGWTSGRGFIGFRLTEGTQGGVQETYSVTAAQYAPVPEPATLFLLGAGLFGTGAAARRRRRNQ